MSEEKKDKNGIPLGINVSPTDTTNVNKNPSQEIKNSGVTVNGNMTNSNSNNDFTPKKSTTGLILGIVVLVCVVVCFVAYIYLNNK